MNAKDIAENSAKNAARIVIDEAEVKDIMQRLEVSEKKARAIAYTKKALEEIKNGK